MAPASTGSAQLVVMRTPQRSWELLTEVYRAVLGFSSDGKELQRPYQLLIVAPTLKGARGIYRELYARLSTIALQDQSNGDSLSE